LPLLDTWLREAELKLEHLDGMAVTTGPGSFTGLRIGIATAKGLAQALGVPLVGVPTLDALALNLAGSAGLICPILDARKGEIYTALYRSPHPGQLCRLTEYLAVAPPTLCSWLKEASWPALPVPLEVRPVIPGDLEHPLPPVREVTCTTPGMDTRITFLGDGLDSYWEGIRSELGPRACRALPGQNWLRAAQVAFLGLESLRAGIVPDLFAIVPAYLRSSEAERKRKVLA
ncbi:MAG: tRNA (adenosine(37)-N6)-threonylcarbamoyltransferase complex dimerization subunit type 1 TsaB, partial [Syntrophomonadaceae bacterium]|nr:tRNA (adenosine(37)-N6)-threonylcarbamoyltransferase complex dimerization subunit type 1 TsaB [Syntrophomonadaceae bacterium]